MVAAADRVLAVIGADTKLIPGHGPLATRKDLEAFREAGMLGAANSCRLTRQDAPGPISCRRPARACGSGPGAILPSHDRRKERP